jgi:O-methyltransferase domain
MSERAPEEILWDCLRGAMMTRALGIVAHLNVAGALADGPREVTDVASELGADPTALHRLLRALASDGVFAEERPGVFRNTEASQLLAGGWGDFAQLFGTVWYRSVGELGADGKETFSRLFGTDFWTWLADHPSERAAFDRAMEQGKEPRIERLASLEWKDGETVVDVGGGNGSLLAGLLAHQPELRGIVFDLPETVRHETALGERIEFVEGSFFERVPEGDAYILSTILHDWDDDRAAAILRTIRECGPAHARLLIIEAVVQPGNEQQGAKWLDLLILATLGGHERTEEDWRRLLDEGGFEVTEIDDRLIQARFR